MRYAAIVGKLSSRTETQHGTAATSALAFVPEAWLGGLAVCAAPPESQAEDTKQPRTASKKRTVSLPGMYPTEQNCGNIGTSRLVPSAGTRSNEMWRRRQLPCEPARHEKPVQKYAHDQRIWNRASLAWGEEAKSRAGQKVSMDFWRSRF